jgi:hypothetical protein
MLKRTPRASGNHADTAGFKGPSRSTRQQTHRRRDPCPNHACAHTLKGVGAGSSATIYESVSFVYQTPVKHTAQKAVLSNFDNLLTCHRAPC